MKYMIKLAHIDFGLFLKILKDRLTIQVKNYYKLYGA